MNMLPKTASGMKPAARTMPAAMLQNRNAISIGSLIAVRKRTIDRAPTIPRESTTLLVTARIRSVVIRVRGDERGPESGRVHQPAVALFIDVKYKQSKGKRQDEGNRHIQHRDRIYILQKS